MEYLPVEIQDKIILPKYYKLTNTNLTLNEKITLGHNLNKLQLICEQINSLHDEYLYKKKHTHFSLLKSMYFPRFILMKNLSKKKNRSARHNMKLYNTIIQLYCNNSYINNTYINNNITYNPYIYTENNINQNNSTNNIISYNYFNNITTYLN